MIHYGIENGLPSNTIYSICHDGSGYLWFCSDNGLARYNGISFEKFTVEDGLPDNEVFAAYEDKIGRLWLATANGKLCYYKDGIFHTDKNTPFLKLPFNESQILCTSIEQDSSVTIFFNDRTKFVNISANKCAVISIPYTDSIQNPTHLIKVQKINNAQYELLYKSGKVILDTSGNIFQVKSYPDHMLVNLQRDRIQGYLYTRKSIYSESLTYLFPIDTACSRSLLYAIYNADSIIFFGTDNGLVIRGRRYLPHLVISSIERDETGNFWISTLQGGAYYLNRDFLRQHLYSKNSAATKFAIAAQDYILFITANGNVYELRKGQIRLLYKNTSDACYDLASSDADMDNDQRLHFIYDNKHITIEHHKDKISKITVYPDHLIKGVKAISAIDSSLYVLMPLYIAEINYKHRIPSERIIQNLSVRQWPFSLAKSTDNTIWYSLRQHTYKICNGVPVQQHSFDSLSFRWIAFYNDYLIGCPTDNKFIICNHPGSRPFFSYVNSQQCVWRKSFRLDSIHIIISTNQCYYLLTLLPSEDTPRYILTALENPIIPTASDYICADADYCYFFKNSYITQLPISDLFQTSAPPLVSFTKIRLQDSTWNLKGNRLKFPYSSSRLLTLWFSPLSFSGKELIYEYSVSHDNTEHWSSTNVNEINFINPDYGTYTIKLHCRTLSSGFGPPIVLYLEIKEPFWHKWWFIGSIILIIVSVTFILFHRHNRNSLKKKDEENSRKMKMLKSEYKALNAMMSPHFIFNTLNTIQSLVFSKEAERAGTYLKLFSVLIRQNMYNISKNIITLEKELELVRNYIKLEQLRFSNRFTSSINIDQAVDCTSALIPPMIIQPLVENAIIHGVLPRQSPDSFIAINVYYKEEKVFVDICDNGVGFYHSNSEQSLTSEPHALTNIRERIWHLSEIYQIDLTLSIRPYIENKDGIRGTVISLAISLLE